MSEDSHPLRDVTDMVSGKESGTRASWIVTLFLIAGLVVGISIIGIKLVLAKRRAAELAAKIRKAEEEKKQAEENIKLANNTTARQAAQEEVKALSKEILGLKAVMAKRETAHKENVKELEGITSWDDFIVVDGREKK